MLKSNYSYWADLWVSSEPYPYFFCSLTKQKVNMLSEYILSSEAILWALTLIGLMCIILGMQIGKRLEQMKQKGEL